MGRQRSGYGQDWTFVTTSTVNRKWGVKYCGTAALWERIHCCGRCIAIRLGTAAWAQPASAGRIRMPSPVVASDLRIRSNFVKQRQMAESIQQGMERSWVHPRTARLLQDEVLPQKRKPGSSLPNFVQIWVGSLEPFAEKKTFTFHWSSWLFDRILSSWFIQPPGTIIPLYPKERGFFSLLTSILVILSFLGHGRILQGSFCCQFQGIDPPAN